MQGEMRRGFLAGSSGLKKASALFVALALAMQTFGFASNVAFAASAPPTVTLAAENVPVTPVISGKDLAPYPTFFIMGKPTTGFNIGGSKTAPAIVGLHDTMKITASDTDGTLSRFYVFDSNNKEAEAHSSPLTVTRSGSNALYISGQYNLEPGGLYTRFARAIDNDNNETVRGFRYIAYTDEVADKDPIQKKDTDTFVNDEVFAKMKLSTSTPSKGNSFDQPADFKKHFQDNLAAKYGVRSIVGYQQVDGTDFVAGTDVSKFPKAGTYDIEVMTTNPHGQSLYNLVRVVFTDTTKPESPILPDLSGRANTTDEISVTAEAGTIVRLYDKDSRLLGQATANQDGVAKITPAYPVPEGRVTATAIDAAGLESEPAEGNATATKAPAVTIPVADPSSLTQPEKDAVKKAVEDANKGNLPSGTQIEVGSDGTVTVRYPNGAVNTIPAEKAAKQSLAAVSDKQVQNSMDKKIVGKSVRVLPATGDRAGVIVSASALLSMLGLGLVLLLRKEKEDR
ncbi:MAG: Ig-like domain-containing protein [Berryella intestinalis]|uniref:Ig-like domain-containing protein n=1 Tax=Berryella intestinalis TaxID=1531429 RepID=UPI002A75A2BD|nr:Ig-like domain-containing protein [Berryella intestinalis]MDY3129699.1 Ig-like domain-containing protein [Berryella intestinalis]